MILFIIFTDLHSQLSILDVLRKQVSSSNSLHYRLSKREKKRIKKSIIELNRLCLNTLSRFFFFLIQRRFKLIHFYFLRPSYMRAVLTVITVTPN